MAHSLYNSFLERLNNTRGQQLLTFVKVFWDSGAIVYSEQEVLYDMDSYTYSLPALITVNRFTTTTRLNSNGSSISYQVTLDDSDGHIKQRMDREILNGVRVELMVNFEGLDQPEGLLIGIGTINSDEIYWGEGERTIQFDVEDILVSKNVAFKPYIDMVTDQDENFDKYYLPMVFGAPRQVPAVALERGKKAIVTTMRHLVPNTPDNTLEAARHNAVFPLDDMTGFPLNTSIDVKFLELDDLNSAGFDSYTGKIIKIVGDRFLFVPDDIIEEFNDVTLAPFDMADPQGFNPGGGNFEGFHYMWVTNNPNTLNLKDQYLDFDDMNGRASLISPQIVEHTDTGSGFRIKLSHQPRWGKKGLERDPSVFFDYKNWYANFTINTSTGALPNGLSVRARAQKVMFEWNTNYLSYIEVSVIDGSETIDDTDVTLREYEVRSTNSNAVASLSYVETIDPTNLDITTYTSVFYPEQKTSLVTNLLTYKWGVLNKSGYEEKLNEVSLVTNTGIRPLLLVPDGLEIFSKYVSNIFTSGETGIEPGDILVRGVTNFSDNPVPVESNVITVDHTAIIPGETIESTIVKLKPPLEYRVTNKLYSGEIVVDHVPAYEVHNGVGGTTILDTENAAEVIGWVLGTYTNLRLVKDETYLQIKARVGEKKLAFAILQEVDALSLANIIAWESKVGLSYFGNEVRLIDLAVEPTTVHDFNVTNSELKTYKLGYIPTTQIVTDFKFRFSKNKDDEDGEVIIFNNNTSRYGKNSQIIEVLTLDNAEDVFDLVKFWGNRLSRSWKTVEFQASIEALKLQAEDAVTFNIPVISANEIIGFIKEITYEPNSMSVMVKAVLACEASSVLDNGEPVTDPSYWEGFTELNLNKDQQVGLVSDLDIAKLQKFSLNDLNFLKPFERRL